MRLSLLSVLVCSSVVCAQLTPLDSLLARSSRAKHLATEQPGFKLQYMPLIPPDELFKSGGSGSTTLSPLSTLSVTNQFVTVHEYDKDMTEIQASINKMTIIMENLQSQSESHRKNLDVVVKIVEVLIGLLGAISTLIATIYGIKSKKK
jgi:hypothetical protein